MAVLPSMLLQLYNGKTEADCELVQLGAAKAVVAGICGTPLHEAVLYGHDYSSHVGRRVS